MDTFLLLHCHWCCSKFPTIMEMVTAMSAVAISMVAVHESKNGNITVKLLLIEIQYVVESWKPHYNTHTYHFSNKIYLFIIEQISISVTACIKYGACYCVLNDVQFGKKIGGPYRVMWP
ncbi:hypothetical protein RFI_25942 [Reticulomyxa filosa]|uniref:Uncharacterized protein n=1 Tax=Reticulomyxa filosa TaxID=46433 RepID=X6MC59_RETFI|nr:hypothetical protein RFI_25942 [Reticulomyxa filosa]|eukprot:ETO11434.1 hypothetical protein RFI_25942 [Reticulomyxa filosa]